MAFNKDGNVSVKIPSGVGPKGVTGEVIGSNVAMHTTSISGSSMGGVSFGGGAFATYYAKPAGTFADAVSAYASSTTLTITGLPYTFTAFNIVEIQRYDSTNVYVETITSKTNTITVSGTTITVSDATSAFASGDQFIVILSLPAKTIDDANNSQRNELINPVWSRVNGNTIADTTNDTDATTNFYIENDGWTINAFQLILDNGSGTVTVTIEASMQDDGTVAASAAYVDVTNEVFGQASFTGTDSPVYLVDDARKLSTAKFIKVKVVTSTGGANDADFTVYHRRLYA